MATNEYEEGMLSREQLIHLFNRFSVLTSQSEVKKRIANAVLDKQEAVAVTTAIQEEEELACEEAELGAEEFAKKLHDQQKLQEQQLEMLRHMRKFHLDHQSDILARLQKQMEDANFDPASSVMSIEQILEIVPKKEITRIH